MANVMQLMSQFPQFMAANRGKNPNQILNEMISSGRITQQQLNQAQQMASRMATQFRPSLQTVVAKPSPALKESTRTTP